jgi:hypothetical protein
VSGLVIVALVAGLLAATIFAVLVVDARRGITTRDQQQYEDLRDDDTGRLDEP